MLDNLQGALEQLFHWFSANKFIENTGKDHHLTISKTPIDTHIYNAKILNEEIMKLLVVNVVGTVIFDFQMNTFLEKAGKSITFL